ncbi:MAG: hypothetical protein WD872_21555 [Pirellulaceae bacterium]
MLFLLVIAGAFAWPPTAAAGDGLIVHEWGTFTSLQDEQGRELSGINIDDEPVPGFVHNLNRFLLSRPVLSSLHWQYRSKGAPRHHPLVTMRLETPVIYFYPPAGQPGPLSIDVSVRFRGGWLTEFYPQAQAEAEGLKDGSFEFGDLKSTSTSSLTWSDLKVGTDGVGPQTSEQVWLAPREVKAANLTNITGESERYLFYRGVGHLAAPLRATLDRQSGELALRGNFGKVLASGQSARVAQLWLISVRQDGRCAFRTLDGFDATADGKRQLAVTPYRFEPADYRAENRQQLEAAMQAALVADGLYADEATALLSTWQRSYFASPGLRLFYLVPRSWTDHYLPLSLSREAEVQRVMIGRLELISDEQQALLERLSRTANSDGSWVDKIPESPAREKFLAGRIDFGDLQVPIPADYQMYLALGRFRNALVAHRERLQPTASLTKFIDTYELHPFRIPKAAKQ